MELRTYLRMIVYKIFVNNIFIKTLLYIVNFYYNLFQKIPSAIKLKKSVPIKYTDMKRNVVFLSITGDKIDCTTWLRHVTNMLKYRQ
jgi:ABC-type anion transport system duplicated permease subunit